MDPLTLALIAGGASLVGGLPDIIPSQYERDQKKELKDLQRKQELGLLGLSEREKSQLAAQYGAQQAQAQAYQQAMMGQASQQFAQPGQAALGMVAAGEQAQRIGQQGAGQIAMADLQRQQENAQYIKDLQAAQAEYKKARQEALVAPFVEAATTGVTAGLGGAGIDKLIGGGTSPVSTAVQQSVARTTDPRMDIARMELVNDSPYGMTEEMFTTWWSGIDDKQKNYYGRIK
jgi:hypothetical protein